jgi:hypothetical protein
MRLFRRHTLKYPKQGSETIMLFKDLQDARRIVPGLEAGQLFPFLVLPDVVDGRPRSLADFRGRKVLLHIWASW